LAKGHAGLPQRVPYRRVKGQAGGKGRSNWDRKPTGGVSEKDLDSRARENPHSQKKRKKPKKLTPMPGESEQKNLGSGKTTGFGKAEGSLEAQHGRETKPTAGAKGAPSGGN